jgi:CMP-N,N'-diacetyllegionaminic acid synthase
MENKVLAIIPARGGSKGIPRKNIKLFNEKPLIAHTIETALKCPSIDKTIVSTEDLEIAEIAKNFGAEVPFLRPEKLAADDSPTLDSIRHAVEFFDKKGIKYNYMVILEPTSPGRNVDEIEEGIKKIKEENVDTVVSVTEYDVDFSDIMIKKENGFIEPFLNVDKLTYRRQDNKEMMIMNGALYLVKRDVLFDPRVKILNPYGENSFLRTKVVHMPKERSIEIDSPIDFEFAEFLHKKIKDE